VPRVLLMDYRIDPRRSANMAAVRSKDTAPELRVRKVAHRMGLRFRLHRRDLPGSPDIVLPKHRLVVFVHGCFWHQHDGCNRAKLPKTRVGFWHAKLKKNVERDARHSDALVRSGWRVLVIWECSLRAGDTHLKALLAKAIARQD
jgi:DNA mismatch endonuclease (patch repair protein)